MILRTGEAVVERLQELDDVLTLKERDRAFGKRLTLKGLGMVIPYIDDVIEVSK